MTSTDSKNSTSRSAAIRLASHPSILLAVLLVILDLDRTLLDTHKLIAAEFRAVRQVFGENVYAALLAEHDQAEFDVFECLSGLTGLSVAAVTEKLNEYFVLEFAANPRLTFLRPGAKDLVKFLLASSYARPVIMTTGSVEYQSFKIGLCPELASLPSEVLSGNKGVRIQQDLDRYNAIEFEGQRFPRFALVDDKGTNLTPIKGLRNQAILIHFVAPDSRDHADTGRIDIERVTNFRQVLWLLRAAIKP
jgi:hypothetical protein